MMIKMFILYSLLWLGIGLVIFPMILESLDKILDRLKKK